MKPARQVVKPTTHRSVGIVNASWVQPEGIVHESELEAAFVRDAILCPAVLLIQAQPFRLDWFDGDGAAGTYVPDYLVTLTDRHRVVVEVRPARFVSKDRLKFDSAAATLAGKGIGFVVITDEHVPKSRQQAGRLILRSARGELAADRITGNCRGTMAIKPNGSVRPEPAARRRPFSGAEFLGDHHALLLGARSRSPLRRH